MNFSFFNRPWVRRASMVISMIITTGAQVATANPVVQRFGSHLKISWDSSESGRWELKTKDGALCDAGGFVAGSQTLDFAKVSVPDELVFSLRHGATNVDTLIPSQAQLSPLPKLTRSANIYQLPVRTYLARANTAAEAGKLQALSEQVLREIKDIGADFVWLTGISEHASPTNTDPDAVKGNAGSYYAIYDAWDVSPQVGSIDDFKEAIRRAHAAGLRVMMDFIPNHTARVHRTDVICKSHFNFGQGDRQEQFFDSMNNYFYLQGREFIPPAQPIGPGVDGVFDTDIFTSGIQLENPARVTGNDIKASPPDISDWYETAKLNYGFNFETKQGYYQPRPKTWDKMVDVARYWMMHGVDGFRVDFAHAVPMEFWTYFVRELKRTNPSVYLIAEAYEKDERMKVPGFSYHAMLNAGFDSIYNSEQYWSLRQQALHPGQMRSANPLWTPAHDAENVSRGFLFTHYMENHDEIRLGSRAFAPSLGNRSRRADFGFALSAYSALLPGNFLIHGGQEVGEDASVFGGFAGDNGRTSIFDFVHQPYTMQWLYAERPAWMTNFRERYRNLFTLKQRSPFSLPHARRAPTFVDLDGANWQKDQSRWIAAYVRHESPAQIQKSSRSVAYLVVTNADPYASRGATIHFTGADGQDQLGALKALGITNGNQRYRFREVLSRPGWIPSDPGVTGEGIPGWALFRAGNVPSGLFLGEIPAGTTYVFEVEPLP